MKNKERYGYIVLAVLSVLGAFTAVWLSLAQVHANQEKFCRLVRISNANPPTDHTARSHAMFDGYARFGESIGCLK
jgi:hypothetical protein